MSDCLSEFATRLCRLIESGAGFEESQFNHLALELFALQFARNDPFHRLCVARGVLPEHTGDWRAIPLMPTAAFKDFEITCLPPEQRTRIFHSSGTTTRNPGRHFHSHESLRLYEASLLPWFRRHLLGQPTVERILFLTPLPEQTPHSSLVHMLGTVSVTEPAGRCRFLGHLAGDGTWEVDLEEVETELLAACDSGIRVLVAGTAFSFVHLLDSLAQRDLRFTLPAGSRVMETGGYKGRSRVMPREELHRQVAWRLGVPLAAIICEYGMSELSSQAYDCPQRGAGGAGVLHFPPWARARILSPESGQEVRAGEAGVVSVVDLANAFSCLALQTEDVALRVNCGFRLVGRASDAEPRGCSLMAR